MTDSLIPMDKVLHSIRVRDEAVYIKDPLYRELRWADIQSRSLSSHRTYVSRLLPFMEEITEPHEWLIGLMANFHNRLYSSPISKVTSDQFWKDLYDDMTNTDDYQLRAHRETILKIMI
jgi:hypothetical protein